MGRTDKKNWFMVYRDLLQSDLWTSEPFTRGQAWIDIIGLANFQDEEILVGAKVVTVYRGQLRTSIAALMKRWNWSKKRVRNFLGALEGAHMVTTEGTAQGITLTVENYAKYQSQGHARGTTRDTDEGTLGARSGHTGDLPYYYIENDKKGRREEENDVASAPSPAPKQHSNNYIPDDEPLPKHVEDWLARTVSTIPRRRTDR